MARMFRFDFDEDAQAAAEIAGDFGRAAAPREAEAAAAGEVPAELREEASALGLLDLFRPLAAGGLGLSPLAAGHAVAALVAEAPTIGTALLLPEISAAFGAGACVAFADGGGGTGAYLRPAGLRLTAEGTAGAVAVAALAPEPKGYLVAAVGAEGDRLSLLPPAAVQAEPVQAMGLTALRLRRLSIAGRGEDAGPFGAAERGLLFLLQAPFFHGYGRAALDYARRYAAERRAFGRPIGAFQGVAFQLAEVAMELEAAELLWQEASAGAAGRGGLAAPAEALLAARDAGYLAANSCVGVLGGHGFVDDHPAERWLRDVGTLFALTGHRAALRAAALQEVEDIA